MSDQYPPQEPRQGGTQNQPPWQNVPQPPQQFGQPQEQQFGPQPWNGQTEQFPAPGV